MDYSGLQVVRSSRQVANIETVAFSQFMNYCEQNGGRRHVSIIEKVKVDTAAQKLEYNIVNDDKSDGGSQVAQTVSKVAQTDYSLMDEKSLKCARRERERCPSYLSRLHK